MQRHWRLGVWAILWSLPLPFVPDVSMLYWLLLLLMAGWALRFPLVLEPKWSIDDELAEIVSWT